MNQAVTFYELLVTVLFWSGVLVLLAGLGIMIVPDLMIGLSQRLNVWISTERLFNRLDQQSFSERFFYKYHIIFGIFLVAAAVYIFYTFMFSFDPGKYSLSIFSSVAANDWLTHSLVFVNLLFSFLIFLIGIIVLIRPSLLKKFEAAMNRWIIADETLKKLDVQMKVPDSMFNKRPRLMGLIIVIGSIYILINLSSLM